MPTSAFNQPSIAFTPSMSSRRSLLATVGASMPSPLNGRKLTVSIAKLPELLRKS